jgi:hypothetical protein
LKEIDFGRQMAEWRGNGDHFQLTDLLLTVLGAISVSRYEGDNKSSSLPVRIIASKKLLLYDLLTEYIPNVM